MTTMLKVRWPRLLAKEDVVPQRQQECNPTETSMQRFTMKHLLIPWQPKGKCVVFGMGAGEQEDKIFTEISVAIAHERIPTLKLWNG